MFVPSHLSTSTALPAWEPALSQLRDTSPGDLDALVSTWLAKLGLHSVRLLERRKGISTYQAFVGAFPASLPVHIRIFQRRNRIQLHHVDALLGALVRWHSPAGLLVTTGALSAEAQRLVQERPDLRLHLLSGREWAKELASQRVGVREGRLTAWLFSAIREPFSSRQSRRRSPA